MLWERVFASVYDRLQGAAEGSWMGRRRAAMLARLDGRVLEIGGGTGANLAHYPGAIETVTLTEPSAPMRDHIGPKLPAAVPPVEVVPAGAEALPFDDHEFDHVVATLVLCSVPDVDAVLSEARRVLVPGGRIHFLEHGGGAGGRRGSVQRAIEPGWRRVSCGCRLTRDALSNLARNGFVIMESETFDPPRVPAFLRPFVQGVAQS